MGRLLETLDESLSVAARPPALVLIADDNAPLRQMIRIAISSDQHVVVEAEDGDEAWELLCRYRPQVAILDLEMPKRSGLEVARAVRADPTMAGTWLILLTGHADRERRRIGFEAGVDEFLTKPFSPTDLILAVERAAAKVEARALGDAEVPRAS